MIPRRRIGTSELEASVFSLGSWHTYDRMDFADAVTMIRTAVDAGVNLFDVGVYAAPDMPPVFTDVIFSAIVRAAGLERSEWMLSSKLWLESVGDDGFRPQLESALFRVGAEHADLVILGDLRRDDLALRDIVLDLARLAEAGLIRAWGVNNWSATTVQQLIDGEPFARLWEQGLTLEASDVLEGGILAGNVAPSRGIGRDPGEIRAAIVAHVPAFAELARSLDATPAQLAIAFTLTHPALTTTLFGATSVAQLNANLAAADLVERVGATWLRELVAPFWTDRGIVDPEGP